MTDRQEFWPNESMNDDQFRFGHLMELRARIALGLVERYGSIAATYEGEDSAGRAKLALQEPAALVGRCFDIAEVFVGTAIARGLIRPPAQTVEQAMERAGRLQAIKHEAETRRWGMPVEGGKRAGE